VVAQSYRLGCRFTSFGMKIDQETGACQQANRHAAVWRNNPWPVLDGAKHGAWQGLTASRGDMMGEAQLAESSGFEESLGGW
jgi:hypothetical protein